MWSGNETNSKSAKCVYVPVIFVTIYCVNMGKYSRYSRANIWGHWCVCLASSSRQQRKREYFHKGHSMCPSVPSVCTNGEM